MHESYAGIWHACKPCTHFGIDTLPTPPVSNSTHCAQLKFSALTHSMYICMPDIAKPRLPSVGRRHAHCGYFRVDRAGAPTANTPSPVGCVFRVCKKKRVPPSHRHRPGSAARHSRPKIPYTRPQFLRGRPSHRLRGSRCENVVTPLRWRQDADGVPAELRWGGARRSE